MKCATHEQNFMSAAWSRANKILRNATEQIVNFVHLGRCTVFLAGNTSY